VAERKKEVRRGFVMTGGGAKGLYEAGVIHALHLTGMEFDVITGSSIGAFNAVFFAEYLLRKRQLAAQVREDPERSVEAMDAMVKAYHHAWLQMPDRRIIDDTETGPLGRLVDDLSRFNVALPDLTRILWWWTDPDRGAVPSPRVWPSLLKLGRELTERLGGPGEMLKILKSAREAPFQAAARRYLARFGMERSLVPPQDDDRLGSVFTDPIAPLASHHLQGPGLQPGDGDERVSLVRPGRTLRDYAEAGIDVRLTRANYRTGRLEVSAYVSAQDFVRYLRRQAFRLQKSDPEKIPLGSFRLHVPGNPDAIAAAMASGRFPGVFAPYPVEAIYPPDDVDNALLHGILAAWLDDPQVASHMSQAHQALHPRHVESDDRWEATYESWRASESMRAFFPRAGDAYVDGGAIDNTPSNSAIDAVREWVDRRGLSMSDVTLDLIVVFLHPEPTVDPAETQDPAFHQVLQRTLDIQDAAKTSSGAVVVETINTFGRRGERLGDALLLLLNSAQEALDALPAHQRSAILDRLREGARERGIRGFRGDGGAGILDRMEDWGEEILGRMPLQVRAIKVYPDEMPLSTLQFTERLGYRPENAIAMLTLGCSNTLWALRLQLEARTRPLDGQDERTLRLARKWMGAQSWPTDPGAQADLRAAWRCTRGACAFHAQHCAHGARPTA
jgi:predicted acylesterase/phospholipase RssA